MTPLTTRAGRAHSSPPRSGPTVTAAPRAVHSPTQPATPTANGEPPTGGEVNASRARSATTRLAPKPVQVAARTAVLALVVIGIHAAASHPVSAVAVAVLLAVVLVRGRSL